ncbi:hypothetical protein B0H12DRAFT_1122915 [Mycena haematopus]|nr:hypothetical protein B0H12DRAFT_1122915 [Mycena haematopus]
MYTEHYAHPALSRICHTRTTSAATDWDTNEILARSHPQIPSHKCRSHEPGVWSKESKEVAG